MKRGFTELLLADSSFSIPTCYTMLHQISSSYQVCNIMQHYATSQRRQELLPVLEVSHMHP
jgi:hypothetical protein